MHVAAPIDLLEPDPSGYGFRYLAAPSDLLEPGPFRLKTDKGFSFCLTLRNDGREFDKWSTLITTKIEICGCLGVKIFQVAVVAHPRFYNLNTISRG